MAQHFFVASVCTEPAVWCRQSRLIVQVESSNEGTAASRDDLLCATMMDYFEENKIDIPAVSVPRSF